MNTNFKSILPYGIFMGLVYITILAIGYVVGINTPAIAQSQAANFQAVQGNMITAQASYIQVLLIFITNTTIGIVMVSLGYLVAQISGLWIGTLMMAPVQAYKTGAILAHISMIANRGLGFVLLAILPHGILELSATFFAMGIGLMLGYNISITRCNDPKYQGTVMIKKWWKVFYKFIVPVYFIAALIEVYITPVVIYLALH